MNHEAGMLRPDNFGRLPLISVREIFVRYPLTFRARLAFSCVREGKYSKGNSMMAGEESTGSGMCELRSFQQISDGSEKVSASGLWSRRKKLNFLQKRC